MSAQENTVLKIYRIIGDRRIPYHLELDPTMNVVVDRPDIELLKSQVAERMTSATHTAAPDQTAAENYTGLALSPGSEVLEETVMPDGRKRIVIKPTPTDVKLGAWVTKLVTDNPIPGTDDLRAEYFADEDAMRAKHAEDGTICKPCEAGALMRKYRAKLEALGHL